MKYFFANKYWLEEQGLTNLGFKLYGRAHIIWMIAIVIFVIFVCVIYNHRSGAKRSSMRKFFAVCIVLSEIVKDVVLTITGAPMMEYLPFHICSFAIFGMLLDAFWQDQKVTGQLMAYAFMPSAICAELFCNWTLNPLFSFMSIFSFVFHAWIIAYGWMRLTAGEIHPNYKGVWESLVTLAVLAVPVYLFDRAHDVNYMFLNKPSEGSPLMAVWAVLGTRFGHFGYILGIFLIMLVAFHLLCFLYGYKIRIVRRK